MDWLKSLVGQFGLQTHCPLCQRISAPIFCPDCIRQLQHRRASTPEGAKVSGSAFYAYPSADDAMPVWAWGPYQGLLKRAMAHLKYKRQPQIAQPMGEWLARAWLNVQPQPPRCLVVPIPLHCDRKQQRGYNQAELIARRFCQVTGLPLAAHGLQRAKATTAQYGLSLPERHQNVQGAFELGEPFRPQWTGFPILLLDDIYTTGATTAAAANTLKHAGHSVHGVLSVARAGLAPVSQHRRQS